eukprot:jgi/Mesvir1/8742/Mv02665-RA.1
MGPVNRTKASSPSPWIRWLLLLLLACLNTAAAQTSDHTAFFCPCLDRRAISFTFAMHYFYTTTSSGAQLRAGVEQAARDRGLRLREHLPVQVFSEMDAINFLNSEVQAGTSGIVTTLYSRAFITPLLAANEAGIPVYIVGGVDPDLLHELQSHEPATGPVRASLRYIGLPTVDVSVRLARQLIASGIMHVECVNSDVSSSIWYVHCRSIVQEFHNAGLSGNWQWRAPLIYDIRLFLEGIEVSLAGLPGRQIGIVTMDSAVYKLVKQRLRFSRKRDATVLVYETSTEVLGDIAKGRRVVALDPSFYSQSYLGLALASAERQTGQMVTSDVYLEPRIYGGQGNWSSPITAEVMQREICRASGNPVCRDPGVPPAMHAGCRCFDRRAVKYRVISGLAQRLAMVPLLWQGMVDAERDLPGSTFDWHLFQDMQVAVLSEYTNLLQGDRRSEYAGVISLDALAADLSVPLQMALRSVSASGLPLYLAYGKSTNLTTQGFLDQYGARSFVGVSPLEAGREIGRFAIGELERKHILGNNVVPILPWSWHLMEGLVVGAVGDDYRFAPHLWDIPVKGNPFDHTGAWQLFTNPGTGETVEIINGMLPILGDAFLPPLAQQLAIDEPPVDLLMMEAYQDVLIRKAVELVASLSDGFKYWRPPIQMVTHKCTAGLFLALARRGGVEGEEYFMGCMDEQPYLCTYLAANIAALEQQTGERVTGEVNTERLLKAGQLPAHFARRVECEMDGYNRAIENRELGQFYPVCDARKGCVRGGDAAPRYAEPCSGHGTCRFPKAPGVNKSLAPLTTFVDPSAGTCGCEFGWRGEYCEEQAGQVAVVSTDDGPHMLLVALLPAMLVVLVASCAGVFAWRVWHRPHDEGVLHDLLRRRGPPSGGGVIAEVVTDIEGSTSLWEWNPEVMKRSLAIHHRVLRSLLPKYHGYESDTEGDSFTLVFHDAIDALGWAMEVQRQLLFPAGSLGLPGGQPPPNPSSTGLPLLQHNGGNSVAFVEGHDPSHTRTSGSVGSAGTAAGSHSSGPSTVELMPKTATSSYQLVPKSSRDHMVRVATGGGVGMREGVATGTGSQTVPPASSQQSARLPGGGRQVMPAGRTHQHWPGLGTTRHEELVPAGSISPIALAGSSSHQLVPAATGVHGVGREGVPVGITGQSTAVPVDGGRIEDQLLPAGRINSEHHQLVPASSRASFILPTESRASFSGGVTDWPPELLLFEACREVSDPRDGCVIYRGVRVRMGIHMGVPDGCIMHPNGRQHYQGEVVEITKAIVGAAVSGGQVLMSMAAWRSLGTHVGNVVCHHMGLHELAERLPPIHLMQVLPAELAHRAVFHSLSSKQLSPSFFDAPGAEHCYRTGESPREPLVICFIYVGCARVLSRVPGYNDALGLFVAFVQERLGRYDAYECEEKDGSFVLAFASAVKAACFAEAVQREAMAIEWPESLLEHDVAAEVVKMGRGDGGSTRLECIVFRGFRLQIGMCMGVPSDCQPHMTTGRAAYFGAVVNRAARIAATAAPGQSLANQEVYESARGQTGDPLSLYEISSPALSLRLFPRTRKLAKSQLPPTNSDLDRKRPYNSIVEGGGDTRVLPPGTAASMLELSPRSAFKGQHRDVPSTRPEDRAKALPPKERFVAPETGTTTESWTPKSQSLVLAGGPALQSRDTASPVDASRSRSMGSKSGHKNSSGGGTSGSSGTSRNHGRSWGTNRPPLLAPDRELLTTEQERWEGLNREAMVAGLEEEDLEVLTHQELLMYTRHLLAGPHRHKRMQRRTTSSSM